MQIGKRVAIAIPVVAVALTVAAAFYLDRDTALRALARSRANAAKETSSPWAALVADFTIDVTGDEGMAVRGRYFQASNGSHRLESGPPGDEARVVFIANVPEARWYSRRENERGDRYWVSGPLGAPNFPPIWPADFKSRHLLPEKVEGLAVMQVSDDVSDVLLAPELNYLRVRDRRRTSNGSKEEQAYRNITRCEPDASLFSPPDGEKIEKTNDPLGYESTRWLRRDASAIHPRAHRSKD